MVAELGTLAWHRQWFPVPSAALPWPAASKMNNESRKRQTVATYFTNLGLASFGVTTHFRRRTGLMQVEGGRGGRGGGCSLHMRLMEEGLTDFLVLNRRSDGTHQFRTLLSSSAESLWCSSFSRIAHYGSSSAHYDVAHYDSSLQLIMVLVQLIMV